MTTINHEPDSYCLPLAQSTSHKPDKCCLRLLRSNYHGSRRLTCPNFTCQVRTGSITSVHIPNYSTINFSKIISYIRQATAIYCFRSARRWFFFIQRNHTQNTIFASQKFVSFFNQGIWLLYGLLNIWLILEKVLVYYAK